jgi:hypothetical protein
MKERKMLETIKEEKKRKLQQLQELADKRNQELAAEGVIVMKPDRTF